MIRLLLALCVAIPTVAIGQTLDEAKEAYRAEKFLEAAEAFEVIYGRDGSGDALFLAGAARFAAGHMAHAIRHVEDWKALAAEARREELATKAEALLTQARAATFAVTVVLPPDLLRDRKQPMKLRFTRSAGEIVVPPLEWQTTAGWDAKPTVVRLDKGDWVAEIDAVGYRPSPRLQVIEEDSEITLEPEVAASLLGEGVSVAVRLAFQEAIDLFRRKRYAETAKSCALLLAEARDVEEIAWLEARALHLAEMPGHAYTAYLRFAARFPDAGDLSAVNAAVEALKPSADAERAAVTVDSSPLGGKVTLAGATEGGTTPVVLQLHPGRYTVTVRLEGHDPVQQAFEVEPKGVQTVSVNLIRPPDPVLWRYGGLFGLGAGSPAGFEHSTINVDGGLRTALGAYVERRLNARFAGRVELRYGFDQLSLTDAELGETVTWARHALEIPLLARVELGGRLSAVVGPSIEFGLKGAETNDEGQTSDVPLAAFTLAGQVGVGYALPTDVAPIRVDVRVGRTATSLLESGDRGLILGHLRGSVDIAWQL